MLPPTDWGFWLALKMARGVGNVLALSMIRAFGSPSAVMKARPHALACAGARPEVVEAIRGFRQWDEVERCLTRLDACGGRLVTWADESYPELLRHIHDPPLYLFVCGELCPADANAVAIVGSRAPSPYGLEMAAVLGEELARRRLTIVSGLARGIDAEAHTAALRVDGRTIAVLGCGIDVVYPSEHHRLQMSIAKQGAVVSEFSPGTKPEAENFPVRNRIISGISLGTIVVEATEKSGSLITAEYAMEQGREVFALPGPVSALSRGPHHLLRQGASMVESADDVVREIAPHLASTEEPAPVERKVPEPPLNDIERRILGAVDDTPVHVDQIVQDSGLPAAQVLHVLLSLELRGVVDQRAGKRFARRRSR